MEMLSMAWQSWSQERISKDATKVICHGSNRDGKICTGIFCQLLRIILPGKIRSVQFNFNDFLGTPELLWLPLGVFYNPGFCEEGARLRWPSAAGPARGRSGGGAGRPHHPPRAGQGLGCAGKTAADQG